MGEYNNNLVNQQGDTYEDEEYDLCGEPEYVFPGNGSIHTLSDKLEITFKVKTEFKKVFRAINDLSFALGNLSASQELNMFSMTECIELKSKTIDKSMLYTALEAYYNAEFKKAKKKAKKCIGNLLSKRDDAEFTFAEIGFMWNDELNVADIYEKNNAIYCRMDIERVHLSEKYYLEEMGSFIGTYAAEVVETVGIDPALLNYSYYPLKFNVQGNQLTIYDVDKKNLSIRLIDKTKLYLVEANIRLPEIMRHVVKQVDKVDKVIASANNSQITNKEALQLAYEKLIYNYDLTCAYLSQHLYGAKLCECRPYEIEEMFKDFDENVRTCITDERKEFVNDAISFDDASFDLSSKLIGTEVNKFSEDYTHWIFKGTFMNIDRQFLESAFQAIKENMQSKGVPEQDISIRVVEIQ